MITCARAIELKTVILLETGGTWEQWGVFVIMAAFVTLICVVAIVMLGRWGSRHRLRNEICGGIGLVHEGS